MLIIPHAAPRLGLAFLVSLVVAVVVGAVLWLQLTSRALGWVGSTFFGGLTWFDGHAVSAADRPIAAGVIVLAVLFGVVGAIVGLAVETGALNRIVAAVGIAIVGAIVGGLLGALLGVPMSWGISIAVALAVFLILYAILAAILVLRKADFKELKDRLLPNQTIETTKETIEWVREQMPLGRKS
jgi:MFS family permease